MEHGTFKTGSAPPSIRPSSNVHKSSGAKYQETPSEKTLKNAKRLLSAPKKCKEAASRDEQREVRDARVEVSWNNELLHDSSH
jgi:hypothetical protein